MIVSGGAFYSLSHWERVGMKEQPLAYLLPALSLILAQRKRGAVQRQHRDMVTRTPLTREGIRIYSGGYAANA
jgi:hypothetical protein